VSDPARRFFSGNSLAQAIAAAASWYGVDPERLAWRQREKRHGVVKAARAVVIEVDPGALLRTEMPSNVSAPQLPAAAPERRPEVARPPGPAAGGRPAAAETARRPRASERSGGGGEREPWRAPGPEAEMAAGEAAARLLTLSGLDLTARVRRGDERLEVELEGADLGRLEALGLPFLEEMEHLLPRAIHGLCGHLVRVRVDGAGLRAEREQEIVALAEAAAGRVAAGGEAELLAPLNPAERRIVHQTLSAHPGVDTESLGEGHLKRIRISPLPPGGD
jgi:spoIIIJ-associated protein